jgi:hypothetical protein
MMRYFRKHIITIIYGLFSISQLLHAQTPTHYPTGQNKVEFTFINVLIYIVFPVLLVVLWIVIRRRKPGADSDK